MRPRVTIRCLSALVLLVGFGLAALRGATVGWAAATVLLALAALGTATVGALARRGAGRLAWVGFLAFGWPYFLLHFGPWAEWKRGYGPAHFTTRAVEEQILPRLAPTLAGGRSVAAQLGQFVVLRTGQSGLFFCAAFHALAAVAFGLLGSAVGLILAARGEGAADRDPKDPEVPDTIGRRPSRRGEG